jgi:hypothetical protein
MTLVECVKKRPILSMQIPSSARKEEIEFECFLGNTRVEFDSLAAMLNAQCYQYARISSHSLVAQWLSVYSVT